ncbi:MAG: YihY/virulence factor BrkB family protein [Desulfobacterales bacterium]|nr:YihY/virulence factor BrkB family protein [Desulfobacterales bacterium]
MGKHGPLVIRRGFVHILRVLKYAGHRSGQEHVPEAAASMAFYSLFSLFPLFLILVAVNSVILESLHVREQILDTILKLFPVASHQMITQNIEQILQARGTVGIVGAIALLWAATHVFTTLVHNLNRAWPDAPTQNVFRSRLVALIIVICLVVLLPVFLLAKTVANLVADFNVQLIGDLSVSSFRHILSNLLLYVFICTTFMFLYRWVPNTRVRWAEAFGGALVAAMAAEAATSAFSWYLSSGLSRYNIVYGSLGALLSFMTWIYIINFIVIFGAHLSAAIAQYTRLAGKVAAPPPGE